MIPVYKQKLTSPKWNRFLGLKLRWRDKIRKYSPSCSPPGQESMFQV